MSSGLIPNHQTSRITTFRIGTIHRRPSLTTLNHTIGRLSNDDGDGYENVTQLRCFKIYRVYSISFNSSNVAKISLELNSKGLYQSSGKEKKNCCFVFPSSTKREIWHVHVVVVQRRLRKVQKSGMHVQSGCFANLNLSVFCRSRYRCVSSLINSVGR